MIRLYPTSIQGGKTSNNPIQWNIQSVTVYWEEKQQNGGCFKSHLFKPLESQETISGFSREISVWFPSTEGPRSSTRPAVFSDPCEIIKLNQGIMDSIHVVRLNFSESQGLWAACHIYASFNLLLAQINPINLAFLTTKLQLCLAKKLQKTQFENGLYPVTHFFEHLFPVEVALRGEGVLV